MVQIIKEITVDVAKRNLFQAIVAKQHDRNSRFLKVTLTNEGTTISIDTNSVVMINASRADGLASAFAGVVNTDGTVTVPLTTWMLELDDLVKCDITVVDSESRKLTSTSFELEVETAAYGDSEIMNDENYDLLVSLLGNVADVTGECQRATQAADIAIANTEDATSMALIAAASATDAAESANLAASKISTGMTPKLPRQFNWYKGTPSRTTITRVDFVNSYVPTGSEDESWNADVDGTGSIKAYRTDTIVTISAEGAGKICMNELSHGMFHSMAVLETVEGIDMLDASEVTSFYMAFYKCAKLTSIDLTPLNLSKCQSIAYLCSGCTCLQTVKFNRTGFLADIVPQESEHAFADCHELVSVDLGRGGLTAIGPKMFYGCAKLEKIFGLESVEQIGDQAFANTPKLVKTDLDYQKINCKLPAQYNWYKGTPSSATITQVNFVSKYTPAGTEEESWNADSDNTGIIKGYRTGTVVTISAEGANKIRMNEKSSAMFWNMKALEQITGIDILDASEVTSLGMTFYNCQKLTSIDLSQLQLPKCQYIACMFQNCYSLQSVKFSKSGFLTPMHYKVNTNTGADEWGSDLVFSDCYELTSVDLGRGIDTLGIRMFYKCLKLEKVFGLESVERICDRAFVYAPKLTKTDLNHKRIVSIGESAFRLSSVEDDIDMSSVENSAIGYVATRRTRWSDEQLAEIRQLEIPDVRLYEKADGTMIPTDSQRNYPETLYCKYGTNNLSIKEYGCFALAMYHEWNVIHRDDPGNLFDTFGAWWNTYYSSFAEDNEWGEFLTFAALREKIGWVSKRWPMGDNAVQYKIDHGDGTGSFKEVYTVDELREIVERLGKGLPTMISMYSPNVITYHHAVLVVGGNNKTRKVAILDSSAIAVENPVGAISWLSLEDIFIEGTDHKLSDDKYDENGNIVEEGKTESDFIDPVTDYNLV